MEKHDILHGQPVLEGERRVINGINFIGMGGVLRDASLVDCPDKLADFYRQHWSIEGAYDDAAALEFQRKLFRTMFPGYEKERRGFGKVVLDVGCGSGIAGRAFFEGSLPGLRYYAIDMSGAIDVAKRDFEAAGVTAHYLQAKIGGFPLPPACADYVFCPGVLHYVPDMKGAIDYLATMLKPGGKLITWIYQKQRRLRAATDDCLREYFSGMPADAAFERMKPLTKLGIALGESKQTITVPEDIFYLGIKAGTYSLQEFIYYHFLKVFYSPDLSFTRHNVNNLNAFYPSPVHFHPAHVIGDMIEAAGLDIRHWNDAGNGVAIIADKRYVARAVPAGAAMNDVLREEA